MSAKYYVELDSGTILETEDLTLWPEAKRLTKADGKRRLKAEALTQLREMLKPGDTVYTICRHVSRSGMSRNIDLYIFRPHPDDAQRVDKLWISGLTGRVLDRSTSDQGVKIGGCGMDMGFALVYELGHAIWPKGTPEPHGSRNGEPDSDGGYALRQEWV